MSFPRLYIPVKDQTERIPDAQKVTNILELSGIVQKGSESHIVQQSAILDECGTLYWLKTERIDNFRLFVTKVGSTGVDNVLLPECAEAIWFTGKVSFGSQDDYETRFMQEAKRLCMEQVERVSSPTSLESDSD